MNIERQNRNWNGYDIVYHMEDWAIQEILGSGCYNHFDLKGMNVLDVGAQVGIFTILAHSQKAKRIYSFEPELKNYILLNENVCDFENVITFRCALSDCITMSTLYLEGTAAGNNTLRNGEYDNPGEQRVITITLDSILESLEKIDLIKIDTEGSEIPILRGASGLIARDHPKFIIAAEHPRGKQDKEVIEELSKYQYDINLHQNIVFAE